MPSLNLPPVEFFRVRGRRLQGFEAVEIAGTWAFAADVDGLHQAPADRGLEPVPVLAPEVR